MIFSELYSAYYNTVAAIISRILDGETDEKKLRDLVAEKAFGESGAVILPALKNEKWQLLRPDMSTPLIHQPTMPLTNLQKRWLKAVSLDPRVKLFGVTFSGLEDVTPLFTPEDYRVYDRYADGDPFEDDAYIQKFHTLLNAIKRREPVKMEMRNRKGNTVFLRCRPTGLEYSQKDDKFRVTTAGCRYISTVNLGRIVSCTPYVGDLPIGYKTRPKRYETLVLKITDERNCLERCMLHFAHFEKQTEKLDAKHYLMSMKYDCEDEIELVIRILSFGARVEVMAPDSFRERVKEKLRKQYELGLR